VKLGVRKYRGGLFKTAYWVDQFRLYIALQKMKLEDQRLKESYLGIEAGEEGTNWNSDDGRISIFEDIKNALKNFEKDILPKTKNWQIAYQWVKSLGDMIMCDSILVDQRV
jgi:hypothetical protein